MLVLVFFSLGCECCYSWLLYCFRGCLFGCCWLLVLLDFAGFAVACVVVVGCVLCGVLFVV